MEEYDVYVGLDVHKDTITVAAAFPGRSKAEPRGMIANDKRSLRKLVKRMRNYGDRLVFCYEAGPCGYETYRWIKEWGHECQVVAPSLVPRKPGQRVKTDRRDAGKLAEFLRNGDLTVVWVPDEEQEAIRELTRAREDMKHLERQLKQKLSAFLLRHGKKYGEGKSKWTQRYYRWLSEVKLESPVEQIVFEEYVDAVKQAEMRVASMEEEMRNALTSWSLSPVVESLMALRGVNLLTAMSVMAELGDISRFDSPRELMSFVGLVPSEHSSGNRRHLGAITKTGNSRVRRLMVESAWSYRFPARRSLHIQKKAEKATEEAKAIAWKAQKRLCRRYRALLNAGKIQKVATTAIARELIGFIWAIVREVTGKAMDRAA
ncbi:MAG: IS110 family transposase [Deltaproteobacteria bacterium]|nr:IS110 family transposase [Deltaproteobacteria bacterium]